MLLESYEHPFSCFITLTYNEDCIPLGEGVRKRDVQLFLKALRFNAASRKIRYYVCSEYGEENERPHYHGILFGVSPVELDLIERSWNKGHVMVGTAEHKSMSYVSNYLVKQGTQEGALLRGSRIKEFSLMSKKPGLGAYSVGTEPGRGGVVKKITNAYQTEQGRAALQRDGFLPGTMRADGRKYPIGRYLRDKCFTSPLEKILDSTNRLQTMVTKKSEENGGLTREEIRIRRQAQFDQQAFRTRPKPRRL